MENIKQILSEELNKMKYMLGYQRGVVISEQDSGIQPTEVNIDVNNRGPIPSRGNQNTNQPTGNTYRDADGNTHQKGNPNTQQKLTIRQLVEKDIAKEKLGITWAQVKERFGSNSQGPDNQLLWKAWKAGWRPGKEIPEQFQTQTYKSYNTKMAPIDAKPIGSVAAANNTNATEIAPLVK